MSQLRPAMAADVRSLIRSLTGFDEDEENFDLCYAFAASNLLYHQFLDPVADTVDRELAGLKEKFVIHFQQEKANDLTALLERYYSDPVFKDHEQHDVSHRILSLLLHLAVRPLGGEWSGISKGEEEPEEQEEATDWAKVLAEGEEVWSPGSEEELSPWTDSEEGEQEEQLKREAEVAFAKRDEAAGKGGDNLVRLSTTPKPSERKERLAAIREEAEGLIQPQYWRSARCEPVVNSCHPAATFALAVDVAMREAGGVNTGERVTLSEYQLLRECLWSLRNPVPSTVFRLEGREEDGRRFAVRDGLRLASVTPEALSQALRPVCDLMTDLRQLLDFVRDVFAEQRNPDSTVPFTYEAYAGSMEQALHILSGEVLELETRVAVQRETFTLLDLAAGLGDWPQTLAKLARVHRNLVGRSDRKGHSNWQRSLLLLSGLHQQVAASHVPKLFDLFLAFFLKSCQPYLRIAGLWMAEGRMEDHRDEFLFLPRHGVGRESERSWADGMEVRNFQRFLEAEGVTMPEMLSSTLGRMLVTGKSEEILSILRKKRLLLLPGNDNPYLAPDAFNRRDLLSAFSGLVKEQLGCYGADAADAPPRRSARPSGASTPTGAGDPAAALSHLDMDPYLALAFAEVTGGEFDPAAGDEDAVDAFKSDDCGGSKYAPAGLSGFQDLPPTVPVSLILARSADRIVTEFYGSACKSLCELVLGTLQLESHLGSVRKVFLLEAGDLMHEFYCDLFNRTDAGGDDLESVSVTLFLQDCLARRYPTEADRFAVSLPDHEDGDNKKRTAEDRLQAMVLSYSVDWPLSIVLNGRALAEYNRVFLFLLEVKRALWSLRQINAKQLIALLVEKEKEEASGGRAAEAEEQEGEMSPSLKMHRVLLLRSWLLHFVGSVHAYFMSRVLHTTELELREELRELRRGRGRGGDLDGILAAHERYLGRVSDRCFLHPSARVLREAVLRVLDVCHRLAGLTAGPGGVAGADPERLDACEATYARAHQFLSSTLSSMTQRRNVPHLDGLAAALAHSCPQVARP